MQKFRQTGRAMMGGGLVKVGQGPRHGAGDCAWVLMVAMVVVVTPWPPHDDGNDRTNPALN